MNRTEKSHNDIKTFLNKDEKPLAEKNNKYRVKFYRGSYRERQLRANNDNAVVYIEQHFNAGLPTANYCVVIVGSNASQTSKNIGIQYSKYINSELGIKIGGDNGIKVGGYNGRGNGNLVHTKMPAVLLEPGFCSNPEFAKTIKTEEGRWKVADCTYKAIRDFFPRGGLVALSVGHKYKTSKPLDRGASVHGEGNHTEADLAELVLLELEKMLIMKKTKGRKPQ